MASKYQKRHYEDVARFIADVVRCKFSVPGGASAHEMGDFFVGLFEYDNPLFDRERFLKACGLEGEAETGCPTCGASATTFVDGDCPECNPPVP